jgi:hypothetical protein
MTDCGEKMLDTGYSMLDKRLAMSFIQYPASRISEEGAQDRTQTKDPRRWLWRLEQPYESTQ